MNIPLIIPFLVFLAASCGSPKKERVVNAHTFQSSTLLRWPEEEFPITIHINDDDFCLDQRSLAAASNAAQSWNSALGRDVILIQCQNVSYANAYTAIEDYLLDDAMIGLAPVSWPVGQPEAALAITVYNHSSNIIKHGDILINSVHSFSTDGDELRFDLESVFLHEIGHFLGVSHTEKTEDDTSVMNPALMAGEIKRVLSAGDVVRIIERYGRPNDSTRPQ